MKILLSLLLVATLGILVALPHIATANDQGQNDGGHHQTDHETGQEGENQFGHETLAEFHIRLTGDQQVPPVNTTAFGFAEIRLFQNGTSTAIEFRVVVCDIANVTHSHIHVGAAGANGPIVVPFFDQPSNPFSSLDGCGTLAHGVRGPSDLMAHPEAGVGNWTGFVHALMSGNTYVNVHTTTHLGGEIRGQLVSVAEAEQDDDQVSE